MTGRAATKMLAGMFRFACSNGLVCGDTVADVRVRHKGQIVDNVIEGAYEVLEGFELVREQRDAMRATVLAPAEEEIFARAALALKYEPDPVKPAPITEAQLMAARRNGGLAAGSVERIQPVQENLCKGGLPAGGANGRRQRTRAVQGIDQSVKVNRALWMLAEEMRRL